MTTEALTIRHAVVQLSGGVDSSTVLAWAETLGAWDIFVGVNALDYSGYPDCRPIGFVISWAWSGKVPTLH